MGTAGRVDVIGEIWWPVGETFAYTYTLSPYDVENMRGADGRIARREVEAWLGSHAGDFSRVEDFSAVIGMARYGWASEESELVFNDCMFGAEV